ncbi:hypothetical protein AVEN_158345-1 [Araneus ventricosus]|uniref:Uncharacterized protein n=1 Tax=Araneus ventricosus TaxID=182803 RepID=A0A4Y2FDG2_ARAVE|nr:hypothetical protein AVEN_158345-1 [Araneus ventricosus]
MAKKVTIKNSFHVLLPVKRKSVNRNEIELQRIKVNISGLIRAFTQSNSNGVVSFTVLFNKRFSLQCPVRTSAEQLASCGLQSHLQSQLYGKEKSSKYPSIPYITFGHLTTSVLLLKETEVWERNYNSILNSWVHRRREGGHMPPKTHPVNSRRVSFSGGANLWERNQKFYSQQRDAPSVVWVVIR